MRVKFVVNPRSRRGKQLGGAARAALLRLGVDVVESATRDVDAIVVAGGDGTLLRQLPLALSLGVPVGIVPLGTFNDLARSLGIPPDVEGACAVIADGRIREIDAARVNGTYYLSEASIGISSRLARLQRPEDKQRFGLLAIVASAMQAARHARAINAEVFYGGVRDRFRVVQLTVANSPSFGGFITVEDASIRDGCLDLYAIEIENIMEVFSVAAAMVSGRPGTARGLRTLRAAAFEVRTGHAHRITADGEPAGTTPALFEVLPRAIRVFTPVEN